MAEERPRAREPHYPQEVQTPGALHAAAIVPPFRGKIYQGVVTPQ